MTKSGVAGVNLPESALITEVLEYAQHLYELPLQSRHAIVAVRSKTGAAERDRV